MKQHVRLHVPNCLFGTDRAAQGGHVIPRRTLNYYLSVVPSDSLRLPIGAADAAWLRWLARVLCHAALRSVPWQPVATRRAGTGRYAADGPEYRIGVAAGRVSRRSPDRLYWRGMADLMS